MRWIVACLCTAALASDETPPRAEPPAAIRPIVDLARAAAPEFFADAVVRLVEAGKIPARSAQVDLFEDAFVAAQGAQQPIRLMAIPGTPPDTRAIYRSKAGELRLDALSLESRILRAMLTVDRPKTRELFRRVSRPMLDPRPCEEPLVADVSAYYDIAGPLAQSAFSAAEKKDGEHVQFLMTVLAGARSPNELAPFARAMEAVELKPAEWELLLSAFAGKLETIGPDFRPFAISIHELRGEVEQLAERTRALGLGTDVLVRGFRKYLVTELAAPRCDESFGDASQVVEWFNSGFRGAQPAIAPEEIKSSASKGKFTAETYFESADSKRLLEGLMGLWQAPEGVRSVADRSTLEWRRRLADFLNDVAAWQPSGSTLDVFHQKATAMRGLLQWTPVGEERDRIIGLCVSFLRSSQAERESPAEWRWQVKALADAAAGDTPKLLEAFRNSGDVGLALYAALPTERW